MLSTPTEIELRRQVFPKRWQQRTEFWGPTYTSGGGWTLLQQSDEGPCCLSFDACGLKLEKCALTSQRRAKPLSRILGRFLIDAGPFRRMVRSDLDFGLWLPFDTTHGYFLPQANGTVIASTPGTARSLTQLLRDWTKPATGARIVVYSTAADFLAAAAGPDLYQRAISDAPGVAEILHTLAGDWDLCDLESLVGTAERLADARSPQA